MADTLMLPFRRTSHADAKDSLATRIQQIQSQKGAFRNVTEQSLLDEIGRNQNAPAPDVADDEIDEEDDEMPETKQEKIWKAREAMLRQLDRARNDTLHALDFVSFLLSKHSTMAKSSMSPLLQQAVPEGTLDARLVQPQPLTPAMQQRLESVSLGWKSDGFKAAASELSAASERLEADARHESAFWAQVADLKSRGSAVSRHPRDSRTIGVHYGFPEAAVKFQNRGFAVLHCDEDGQLRSSNSADKLPRPSIRVTMYKAGQETGHSQHLAESDQSEGDLNQHLSKARTALFEEELFYEACREARIIANQGVTTTGDGIIIEIAGDRQVRIHMANNHKQEDAREVTSENYTVDAVCISLRLLLAKAHQQKHARRSTDAPVMTLISESSPECWILRPVIAWLRNTTHLNSLRAFCEPICTTFKTAGLAVSLSIKSQSIASDHLEVVRKSFPDVLLDGADSTFEITMPTSRRLELKVRTGFGPLVFGTEYTAADLKYDFGIVKSPRFGEIEDVQNFICHALKMDLVAYVAEMSYTYDSEQSIPRLGWKATNSYSGDMEIHDSKHGEARMTIKLGSNRLGLRHLTRKPGKHMTTEGNVSYVWEMDRFWEVSATGRLEHKPRQLSEVVRALTHE